MRDRVGLTGTLRANRKYLCLDVQNARLNRGQLITGRARNILFMKWKDRRDVMMLSNCHNSELNADSNKPEMVH